MSGLPHTLDNLYKREKDKVLEMLRQLNELKKRCSVLERDLDAKELEKQRLSGREEVMTRQLEETQAKLLEAVEASKESQVQIDDLSLKLQKSEADQKALTARYHDSQAEAQSLGERMRQLRQKHQRLVLTASTQTKIVLCDKSANTFDTSIDKTETAVQVSPDTAPPTPPSPQARQTLAAAPAPAPTPTPTPGRVAPSPFPSSTETQLEADDELAQLISILNPF
jgi:chromosome segregation ATPase